MKSLIKYISNHLEVVVTLFIVAGIFLYVQFRQASVNDKGVITIAKVTNYEGAESGSVLYIDIYLNDKVYSTTIGYGCNLECIGKYFFVRVDKDKPKDYPFFYGEKEVPECILRSDKKYAGWSDFPKCP